MFPPSGSCLASEHPESVLPKTKRKKGTCTHSWNLQPTAVWAPRLQLSRRPRLPQAVVSKSKMSWGVTIHTVTSSSSTSAPTFSFPHPWFLGPQLTWKSVIFKDIPTSYCKCCLNQGARRLPKHSWPRKLKLILCWSTFFKNVWYDVNDLPVYPSFAICHVFSWHAIRWHLKEQGCSICLIHIFSFPLSSCHFLPFFLCVLQRVEQGVRKEHKERKQGGKISKWKVPCV